MESNLTSAYLIIAGVFVIVGAFLVFVRRLLKESEQELPPPRKPGDTHTTPPNRV